MRQAAREEEAANRANMPGRDAFEELKRMAAATISATPPGLRGAAPSGNGKEQEASTSGNGKHLLLALGIERMSRKEVYTKYATGVVPVAATLLGLRGVALSGKQDGEASAVAPAWTVRTSHRLLMLLSIWD